MSSPAHPIVIYDEDSTLESEDAFLGFCKSRKIGSFIRRKHRFGQRRRQSATLVELDRLSNPQDMHRVFQWSYCCDSPLRSLPGNLLLFLSRSNSCNLFDL
ncbi:hypothetical protein CKAN_02358400 [Cinnamomum micranthum f. kanehirae]|uniref:Uncharacterized protein n=1 Tax=Cinnamomum micranthum f. kanehirae TaxID=337451 RepID=A0A443PU60_9MAGN|nr:hypothetical protein CKAN_02358400 [Cinnamomum micranthum f. kanehirae]